MDLAQQEREVLEEQAELSEEEKERFNYFSKSMKTFDCGESKILSCRMESNGQYFGFGCEDGKIRVFKEDHKQVVYQLSENYNKTCAVTQIRWKDNTKYENILVTGHADGSVLIWHVTSRQLLKSIVNEENPIYGLDFAPHSSVFASGGQDTQVRIYNLDKLSQRQVLDKTSAGIPSHSNRVFGLKWVDSNCLLSAGWDKVVLLWDIRVKAPQSYLYGPSICGDSLDYSPEKQQILTGSYDTQDQLNTYDIRNMKRISKHHIPSSEPNQHYYVYAAQYSRTHLDQIVIGTAGINEIQLYRQEQNSLSLMGKQSFDHGIYSIDMDSQKNAFLYSGNQGQSGMIDIQSEE